MVQSSSSSIYHYLELDKSITIPAHLLTFSLYICACFGLQHRILSPFQVLVRLRVEHAGFPAVNQQRFGAQFVGMSSTSSSSSPSLLCVFCVFPIYLLCLLKTHEVPLMIFLLLYLLKVFISSSLKLALTVLPII